MKIEMYDSGLRSCLLWHDRFVLGLTGLALCSLLLGCGQKGPPRVAVMGTVSLDGELIPKGTVHFVPVDQPGELVAATVEDGIFQLPQDVGPLAGAARIDVQVHRDLGFDLDDEEAFAAAAASSRKNISPIEKGVEFRDPTSREVTFDEDQFDLEIELVTVQKRSRK